MNPSHPSLPDAHDMPGPTLDEEIQVFEGRHLASSLVALAVLAFTFFWVVAHWK